MYEVPTVEELYKTIISRSALPLPGMEEICRIKALERAERIHNYLCERADRLEEDCIQCGRKKARRSLIRFAYDTPWDEEPEAKLFCSDECGDIYMYEEPWSYFICRKCEREVCRQNPKNGWHIQYRDYKGETVCLRCYQDLILKNGVEREKLEVGLIPGMFFSWGNTEAINAGYKEVPGYTNFYVRGEESAQRFIKKALELMDSGFKVVIGYERMGIGGVEGYVTLLVKEAKKPKRNLRRRK